MVHALMPFLTIDCLNTRKHLEAGRGPMQDSHQSQRRQGKFLLSEAHGDGTKAEERLRVSKSSRINLAEGAVEGVTASQIWAVKRWMVGAKQL